MKSNKTLVLGLLCCLVYFSSYVTRINYAAALAEIVRDLNISKQAASIAVTGSFITYGLGQIISGFLGDKIKPRRLITFGLACTSLINLSMAFLPNITLMNILWCFNGFFQALLWPPLVRLMSENFNEKEYSRYVLWVSASSSIATILVYLMVPFAISVSGWRLSFLISAAFGLLTAFLWTIGTLKVKEKNVLVAKKEEKTGKIGKEIIFLLMPICFAIILQGILRDGIITWLPTYINEVFGMGVSASTISTAVLPFFAIFSFTIANAIYSKIQNEVKTSALFFSISLVCCIVISALFSKSFVICLAMMALVSGCMHGCNIMLVCQIPARFSKFGKVSTVSGILNSFTYIGSAISTYGFAAVADNFGWRITTISWIAICFIAAVICLTLIKKWKNFCE